MSIPLIVSMGYGPEHPVFLHAKDLWTAHRRFFRDVAEIIFHRTSLDLDPSQFSYFNGEYAFGPPYLPSEAPKDRQVSWDSEFIVDRQLKLYRKLLEAIKHPFWFFATSVTSVIDCRALRVLVDHLDCRRTYAGGMLETLIRDRMGPDLPAGSVFRMVSGAGTLLSSDLLELALERSPLLNPYMLNDVWLSLVLRDIPRVPLLRYDMTDVTEFTSDSRPALHARIKQAREEGHFHFRVKSGRWETKDQLVHDPERIDPLVINDLLLEMLSSPSNPEAVLRGWNQHKQQICDLDGQAMKPIA